MALTDRVYLGSTLLKNISGTFSDAVLDEMISREGDVYLAAAAAYELEASNVMYSFSAGDISADPSKYANTLLKLATQRRADSVKFSGEPSSVVSWSPQASFGTAEVEDYIDEEEDAPIW